MVNMKVRNIIINNLVLFGAVLVLSAPETASARIIEGFGIAGTHFWFMLPQVTSLDDIGGLMSVEMTPNFSVQPGEVLFDTVSLFGPATSFTTDGTSFIEVFFSDTVQENELPLQPFFTTTNSPTLESSVSMNGAFSFVEKGATGTITGTTQLAAVPVSPSIVFILLSLAFLTTTKLMAGSKRDRATFSLS